jgi:potassium channel subfamily K, other eukaryote
MPRIETIHGWTIRYPWLVAHLPSWIKRKIDESEAKWRVNMGFMVGPDTTANDAMRAKEEDAYASGEVTPGMNDLVNQHEADIAGKTPDASALARQLALAIKRAAHDMSLESPKQYTFEQWVEFTRLIRFSAVGGTAEALKDEEDEGLVEWDWLAENSPMMAQATEAEFVLERLCESLVRYVKRNPPHAEFAENLREHGEDALRLRSSVAHDDQDVEAQSPTERRPSLISKIMSVGKSLQPVKEEDHDNQISRAND